MAYKELEETIKKYYPKEDFSLVKKAYEFSKKAHEGQKRKSGEPYFIHCEATAMNLAKYKMEPAAAVAGLLHDILEDTKYDYDFIKNEFGKEIAEIVEGVTKLKKVKLKENLKHYGLNYQIENLQKLFLAFSKDIRVVAIKLCDRLHNMETLHFHNDKKKEQRIAKETLEIYTPLAHRLGMYQLKGKMEDLCFRALWPKEYKWIEKLIGKEVKKKERFIIMSKHVIKKELDKAGVSYLNIYGRVKHKYTFYLKMLKKDKDINKINDLYALRIIVPSIQECYSTLGIIHGLWKPLVGRVKDYIALPKPNGYRSLHTTIFGLGGKILEIQIRTKEMNEEAEYGIAAHWLYKKGDIDPLKYEWVKQLSQMKDKTASSKEYFEILKKDFLHNRIFVFTPKGDIISLPECATLVDMAYHVHTGVGNTCVGAKINERIAKLDAKLHDGDIVEILVQKNSKPNKKWLDFVKTSTAKYGIRKALKLDK